MPALLTPKHATVEQSAAAPRSRDRWILPILVTLALALTAFSAVSRLYNLGSKLVWYDEEFTFSTISSLSEIAADQNYTGKPMSAASWRHTEDISPKAPLSEVLHNLTLKKPPDQAPLFYLAAKIWAQIFGSEPASIRLLTVIFSFIALPLTYILAVEMFNSREAAWLSVGLAACSPFQMLYAQEARPYSMWLCAALLAWIMLCKAHKEMRPRHWVLYGIAGALSLTTHYCSLLVQSASFISALATRQRAVILRLAGACLVTLICLLPWLAYAGLGFLKASSNAWLSSSLGNDYVRACLSAAAKIFFDIPLSRGQTLANLLIGLFELVAMAFAYSRANRAGRIVLQSAALYLVLIGSLDIVSGGLRLTVMRYLTPSIIIIEICAAAYLSALLRSSSRLGVSLLCLLVASGVISCTIAARTNPSWTKEYAKHRPLEVASLLNRQKHALWIGTNMYEVLLMSRLVNNHVLLELSQSGQVDVPSDIDRIFVCDPEGKVVSAILKDSNWVCKKNSTGQDLFELSRK